jgi:hypothetical protein
MRKTSREGYQQFLEAIRDLPALNRADAEILVDEIFDRVVIPTLRRIPPTPQTAVRWRR